MAIVLELKESWTTKDFFRRIARKKIKFFSPEEIETLDIVLEKDRQLIKQSIEFIKAPYL